MAQDAGGALFHVVASPTGVGPAERGGSCALRRGGPCAERRRTIPWRRGFDQAIVQEGRVDGAESCLSGVWPLVMVASVDDALQAIERAAVEWNVAVERVLRYGNAREIEALDEGLRRMASLVKERREEWRQVRGNRRPWIDVDPFAERWRGSGA